MILKLRFWIAEVTKNVLTLQIKLGSCLILLTNALKRYLFLFQALAF